MEENRKANPVVQVDDKYFGNLWEGYSADEDGNPDDHRIGYLLDDDFVQDMHKQRPKDAAPDITFFISEIELVEARLAELTGIPVFNPTIRKDVPEEGDAKWYWDERDRDPRKDTAVLWAAAIEHRREWVMKAIEPSNPKSPFAKLAAELIAMVLEYCCDDLEECDSDSEPEWGEIDYEYLDVYRLKTGEWKDWAESEAPTKELVRAALTLSTSLFAKWKLLRTELVKKYEATEETKKEWEELRAAGELPYPSAFAMSSYY